MYLGVTSPNDLHTQVSDVGTWSTPCVSYRAGRIPTMSWDPISRLARLSEARICQMPTWKYRDDGHELQVHATEHTKHLHVLRSNTEAAR